jgi:hypothetical protein
MIASRHLAVASSLMLLASVPHRISAQTTGATPPPPPPGLVASPPLESPLTELDPIPRTGSSQVDTSAPRARLQDELEHDALKAPGTRQKADRSYAPQQPPAPVAERPPGRPPESAAQWVPGYWDWDPVTKEFAWMGGVWQIPPAGSIWVAGRWIRDQNGWYRKPGQWNLRRDPAVAQAATNEPAWRVTGPPADHPPDTQAPAPGSGYFFVAGHYKPDGDQLKWTPGFWASSQPGWDWVPARWVRRATGWDFRDGYWVHDTAGVDVNVSVGGNPTVHVATRGAAPPVAGVDEHDPIAAAEQAPHVHVVPAMPYYVIRPPGSYPYGPAGVVVPGVVPPFVRDILNQVLP